MSYNQSNMTQYNTRPKAPVLIFDIETVPDIPLLESTYDYRSDTSFDLEKDWKNIEFMTAICSQNEIRFCPPVFHNVISICAVFVHPETNVLIDGFKRSIALPESYAEMRLREKELLEDFWKFSIKYKDHSQVWYDQMQNDMRMSDYQRRKLKPIPVTFCGYNIAEFDLPVIEQRSLRYLLTCPIEDYAKESGTDSYRYKFALDKSYDLCQFIANHQSGCKAKLDVVARSMGLGGKMTGMDGSKVAEEYFVGRNWDKIEEYCAVDVLITYGVYLAVQKFRGILSESEFKESVRSFEKFLRQEGKPPSYRELADSSGDFFNAAMALSNG